MNYVADKAAQDPVAPFAGAWIEIREDEEGVPAARGRSLRGSVD